MDPLLLIIGALVGGALLIKTYWGEIKSFFTGFWEGFTKKTNNVTDAFGRLRDEAVELVQAFGVLGKESDNCQGVGGAMG